MCLMFMCLMYAYLANNKTSIGNEQLPFALYVCVLIDVSLQVHDAMRERTIGAHKGFMSQ